MRVLFFTLFFLFCGQVVAQKYLIVDNFGKKRYYYEPGDVLLFKQKGDKTLFRDQISGFQDSAIVLASIREPMALSTIEKVYRPSRFAQVITGGLLLMGVGFGISGLTGIENDQRDHQTALAISAGSFAGAGIAYLLRYQRLKVKEDKIRIRILDTAFEEEEE